MKSRFPAALILAAAFAAPALADDNDKEMRNLAIKSGCFICHALEAGA
ncbi:MAG: hypothetical protein JNM82_09050 [Rhodocyclaceae bacterium]|nr:hypothetical protein [Rhodocyclaceae bacterium]